MEALVTSIVDYTRLLSEAKTPSVATWDALFITQCADWCVFIETELSILTLEECEHVRRLATTRSILEIPAIQKLLDSLHIFFYTLLQNVHTSNTLYHYILQNYRFLSIPEKDILFQDLAELSHKTVVDNILSDMLRELNE